MLINLSLAWGLGNGGCLKANYKSLMEIEFCLVIWLKCPPVYGVGIHRSRDVCFNLPSMCY